jgi:hypothetical protein
MLDRLTPEEHRIIATGTDLDVELTTLKSAQRTEARLIVYERDALVEHFVRVHDIDYDIINKSASGRTVFLTLNYVNNSRVEGADELDFDTIAGKALAVFTIGAKTQRARRLHVEEGLSRQHRIADLTAKHLTALATETKLHPDQRALLRTAAEKMQEAEQRRDTARKLEVMVSEVEEDLKRLRAHLSAARQGQSDAAPFVERILANEDKRSSLRERVAQLKSEREQRVAAAITALSRLRSNPGSIP